MRLCGYLLGMRFTRIKENEKNSTKKNINCQYKIKKKIVQVQNVQK